MTKFSDYLCNFPIPSHIFKAITSCKCFMGLIKPEVDAKIVSWFFDEIFLCLLTIFYRWESPFPLTYLKSSVNVAGTSVFPLIISSTLRSSGKVLFLAPKIDFLSERVTWRIFVCWANILWYCVLLMLFPRIFLN